MYKKVISHKLITSSSGNPQAQKGKMILLGNNYKTSQGTYQRECISK